jgi:hypothetical protein
MLAVAVGFAAWAGAERHDATYTAGDTVAIGFTWPAANGNWVASDGNGDQAGMWVVDCVDVSNNPGSYVRLALDSSCRVHVVVAEGAGHAYAIHQVAGTSVSTTATTAGTTPTTTTASTSTTAVPEPDPCEHAMQNNEIRLVHKACSVKGDVQVASSATGPWTTLYDDDPATGLVVTFTADTYVRTPWGANVTSRTLESIETELKSVGCVSGCTTVVKKTWPEGTSTSTTVNGSTSTTVNGSSTSTTSTGSSTSTTAAQDCAVTTIAAGQTKTVPAGSVLDGDVKVNGTALYDNDPATALRVVFNESATVSAEWGASYVPSGCEVAASAGLTVKMWPSGSTATTTLSNVHNVTATTASSTSTTASSTVTADTCVAQIANGQTLRVKAGCHVQGDVQIDGVAKYDNAQETGLIVVLTKDADVKAPWGASVSSANVEDIKASMMMVGCGLPAGCTSVNVVTV